MKFLKIVLILAVLGMATACPKRQTAARLVYAPAPPPAPSGSSGQVMVIENPPPMQSAQPAPQPAPGQLPLPQPRPAQPPRPAQHHPVELSPAPPKTVDAPPLEPLQSTQQQTALIKQFDALKSGIEYRIRRLSRTKLSGADRKALRDARAFLHQADQAMKKGDLQGSMNLAQKADLLVSAVEKRQ